MHELPSIIVRIYFIILGLCLLSPSNISILIGWILFDENLLPFAITICGSVLVIIGALMIIFHKKKIRW